MTTEIQLRSYIRDEKRQYLVIDPSEFVALKQDRVLPSRHIVHLRKSRRLRGEIPITVADGCGLFVNGLLTSADRLEFLSDVGLIESRSCSVTLAQASIRDKNTEWLLQKCTELGVDKIIFFNGDFSSQRGLNRRRAGMILENAMMQSLNFFRPKIEFTEVTLPKLPFSQSDQLFYGKILSASTKPTLSIQAHSLIFINGPEGGFSSAEYLWLQENAQPLSFSQQILRSETAAICAIYYLKALTL